MEDHKHIEPEKCRGNALDGQEVIKEQLLHELSLVCQSGFHQRSRTTMSVME